MGLFGQFIYENKKKEKFWLHAKQRGNRTLYYFSKDPRNALNALPRGFEVFENEKSGLPMLRKKEPGFLSKGKNIFGKEKKEEK